MEKSAARGGDNFCGRRRRSLIKTTREEGEKAAGLRMKHRRLPAPAEALVGGYVAFRRLGLLQSMLKLHCYSCFAHSRPTKTD